MARRKSGRPLSGWVIIDKPSGMTSSAVVNKVRWSLDAQKAGHAGTLDPSATGLLAIALGEATKTVPYISEALKAYEFDIAFGAATSTDDSDGEIIETSPNRPTDTALKDALPAFTGEIMQVPPRVSAVKLDGKRAYDLAREGETFELNARKLWVEELKVTKRDSADGATLQMVCGKGGYVRSVARDLGQSLGTCAHVTRLRRIWSGPFDLSMAHPLDKIVELERAPELDALVLPLELGLRDVAKVIIAQNEVHKTRNGNPTPVIYSNAEFGEEVWAACGDQPLGLGVYRSGHFHPKRIFQSLFTD